MKKEKRKKHPLKPCMVYVYDAGDDVLMAQCFERNANPRSLCRWVYNGNKVGVTDDSKAKAIDDHWYEAKASAFECILIKDLGVELEDWQSYDLGPDPSD